MKKSTLKYFSFSIITLLVAGCDNFLNENPDNRVELNNTEKAAQLLTNAYSNAGYTFTEWMSDNVSFTAGTRKFPENTQAYGWKEFTGLEQDTPSGYWTTTYDCIAHSNEVLAVLDELPGERDRKDAVEAEALLTRAYGHFMLVNLFAKHYNKQTAKSDPGVPYVEEPETVFIKKYERNTVEEVYDKIEKDLLRGLKLVDESFYTNSGKYHFTRNSALGFASRFYLYKGDLNNCVKYSSQLLGADPDKFVKDLSQLKLEQVNPEDYVRLYNSPADDSNLLLIKVISNFHVPSYGHWPIKSQYAAMFNNNPFGASDERRDPAYIAGSNGLAATRYEFLFERTSITSNVGYNYTITVPFRGEEVLLNRAESYTLQGELSLAMEDLQVFVDKRYPGNSVDLTQFEFVYKHGDDQLNLLQFILDERQKEFLHQGLRWFDIKRYSIPVSHIMPDGPPEELAADDLRKVIQIPQAAIDVGGLDPNPR
jgi:hypothetical protein